MGIFNFLKKNNELRAEEPKKEGSSAAALEELFSREEITRSLALQVPAVAAAIEKLALTVAKLPVRLYTTDNEKRRPKEIQDDIRPFLLSVDCGDTLSIADFWRAVIEDYYLGNGAFIYIDKHKGMVRSLRYVESNRVAVSVNTDAIFKDYDVFVDGVRHYPFEFIKILRKTKDGATSKSITKENSKILSVAVETLKFEKKQVKRGGNKRGFFKSKSRLDKNGMDDLKEAIRNLYNNDEDSDRDVILNNGIEFEEASATSMDLQLNENKRTNANEIFEIFGFPSSVVLGGATSADKEVFIDCVVNLLNVIEAALDKDLLLESEKRTKYFAFDTRELTRGNIKERFEAYGVAIDKHFMQVDEVRESEDMEPLGFNYISLGLGDVLVNPTTKEVFVPNTGQSGKINNLEGGENK